MSTTITGVVTNGVVVTSTPLPEGATVEVTVAQSKLPPDEWERQIRSAKTIQEWAALANACPDTEPDFDLVKAMNETRRLTGFRLPDPETSQGEPA